MKCFLPCFEARRKPTTCTCGRKEKYCNCRKTAPANRTTLHDYKMAPMIDIPEDTAYIWTTDSPSNRSVRSVPHSSCNGARAKLPNFGSRRQEGPMPTTSKAYSFRKPRTEKFEASYQPREGCHGKPKSGRRARWATGRDQSDCSPQEASIGTGSTASVETGRQAHVTEYRGASVAVPVVCIMESATHTPVVDYEQLFAIMRKKPGWMMKPETKSAEGWVIFQHWNKNRCDANARLPYPNLRLASPEILDSFVKTVNNQQQRKDFDLLSSTEHSMVHYRQIRDAVKPNCVGCGN